MPTPVWVVTLAGGAVGVAAVWGAARALRPGGRMIYATCSLLQCENGAQARAFAAPAGFELEEERNLTPLDGGDGFDMSRLRCNSRSSEGRRRRSGSR